MTKVIKRDGSEEEWSDTKIKNGLTKSSSRSSHEISESQINLVIKNIKKDVKEETIHVDTIYKLISYQLEEINKHVLQEFISFNKYKERYAESFNNVKEFSSAILFTGNKENANKDTSLNSTKQAVISESIMKELFREFELDPKWIKAHDEGWIHIHDLGSRFLNGINCCLFDMANLLNGGFEINGFKYEEPKGIQTAFNVIGDVTLSASGNQYGGFTIPEIDTVLAQYAEKSYVKWKQYYEGELENQVSKATIEGLAHSRVLREIEKGYIGFETKINTISNSLGQVPFVTVSLGLDTSYWAKIIAMQILKIRERGMGVQQTTAVFPKIIFLSRAEVNRNEDSPNYDLYEQSIKTSKRRMYPDYLSLDNSVGGNNLADIYEKSGLAVSPMGCRAFLGEFRHPETGEMVITGRNNIGAVSLNLVKISIESKKDEKELYRLIDKYAQMVWDIHDFAFEQVAKSKGGTNPLLFCEGGSWMSVGYDEEIRPIIKASTASIGYVGLNEASQYFSGKPISENGEFCVEVLSHLKSWVDKEKSKHDYHPALYSTPAESLIYRFQKINKADYGIIENVTDKEYMTNSFHVHVTEEVNPVEKAFIESPYHKIALGGRISFAEYPFNIDNRALKHCVDHAMNLGLYYGVNIVSSSCNECGHQGDFSEVCPVCQASNITSVTRACGYLSFSKIKGDTRYNKGKQAEIKERVKHIKQEGAFKNGKIT